jgi:hypothetical protein
MTLPALLLLLNAQTTPADLPASSTPDLPPAATSSRDAFLNKLFQAGRDDAGTERAWRLLYDGALLSLGVDLVAASFSGAPHFLPSEGQRLTFGIPGIILATVSLFAIAADIYGALHRDLDDVPWRELSSVSEADLPSRAHALGRDRRHSRELSGWLGAISGVLLATSGAILLNSPGSVWFSSSYLWVGLSCAVFATATSLWDALDAHFRHGTVEQL